MPIWDNQMSIPDQSHTNPGPIIFQSGANQMPIQGHSLDQSRIIWSIFLPIQANPILIQCRSDANPRSIFLWIFANPCQSMPILANPMPISGQSVTSYVLNHRTSPLYGMVPSPLGGWIKANSPVIDWQVVGTGPNPLQSWQIQWQFQANPCQPMPIHVNPCQSMCQSQVNFSQKKESLSIVQSEPIPANPMPIHANPMPISGHLREPFPHLS